MKITLIATLAAACMASTAFAGNPATPTPVIPLVTPAAQAQTDWSGPYIGFAAGYEFGEYDRYGNALDYLDTYQIEGTVYSGFAGYNFQRNALVFGAEIAYSLGNPHQATLASPNEQLDNVVDLKARAGYAFGNMLAYGVVGGSFGQWSDTDSGNAYAFSGFTYGGGLEAQFGNGFFAGIRVFVPQCIG